MRAISIQVFNFYVLLFVRLHMRSLAIRINIRIVL